MSTLAVGLGAIIFSKNYVHGEGNPKPPKSFYRIELKSLEGDEISLSDFRGRKVLIVNVASRCGFTSQYKELQELYSKYKDKLVIIAAPCNDFGWQEPGSPSDIRRFCDMNYQITFPIIEKQNIKSVPRSELYSWLSMPSKNGWNKSLPSWNFCKYLVNEDGELTHFFRSNVKPMSETILSNI